jgi:hypothetical protein
MTFSEIEQTLPSGFHDAKIERISLDYPAASLVIEMRILVGTPGEVDQEEYGPAELRVGGLYFCSIEPPDSRYPFKPKGKPLGVSGDDPADWPLEIGKLLSTLPPGTSCYRFFVEDWNSFIWVAGSDVRILWTGTAR